MTTTIPDDLAEDLRDHLARLALSPRLAAKEAGDLLSRLEHCMESSEAPLEAPSPLEVAWPSEELRELAGYIVEKTGIVPLVVGEKKADMRLEFQIRNRHGDRVSLHLDLDKYHPRDGVKHALRDALRTVRLDHHGAPFEP